MNPLYESTEFSDLLLQASASLREVGIDDLSERFVNAVFDRTKVDQVVSELRHRVVQGEPPAGPNDDIPWGRAGLAAKAYTHRLLQRLDRCIRLNHVSG